MFDQTYAQKLDVQDPLSSYRDQFEITDPDLIYVDGNSLGRMPKATAKTAQDLVQNQWGNRLIRGWNEGWIEAPDRIGAKIAKLIGADPSEVIMADSTTINLFKLAVAALRFQQGRTDIVTDNLNFPSDLYALTEACDLLGGQHQVEMIASADDILGPEDALEARLDERTALLTLCHVVFKSGYRYDLARMNDAAHKVGALTLWDLSHSVGAMPIDLNGTNTDLAIGCTYKYLNGGPGAPAFLYVRKGLQEKLRNPIGGWMGRKDMFSFALDFEPDDSIRRFLTGTPSILSLSLVEPSLDLFLAAGIDNIWRKSVQQSEYLQQLWHHYLAPLGYRFNSPENSQQRGSHISLGHEHAFAIDQALIHELNVIPDFRPPDNIRLGITPLYTRFVDIYQLVMRLREAVVENVYTKYEGVKVKVT
ncbi:MAG: kynureninase [Chloroflexota bacterium]